MGWEGGQVQAVIGEGGEEGGGSEIVFEVGGAAREVGRVEESSAAERISGLEREGERLDQS